MKAWYDLLSVAFVITPGGGIIVSMSELCEP